MIDGFNSRVRPNFSQALAFQGKSDANVAASVDWHALGSLSDPIKALRICDVGIGKDEYAINWRVGQDRNPVH